MQFSLLRCGWRSITPYNTSVEFHVHTGSLFDVRHRTLARLYAKLSAVVCEFSITSQTIKVCPITVICMYLQHMLRFVLLNVLTDAIFRRVRKITKSDFKIRHVCASIHMEQFGYHRTDFYEI